MTVAIYALRDPRNAHILYVGKSINPSRRYAKHCQGHHIGTATWVMELAGLELRPELVILEETDQEHWPERERYWIEFYSRDREVLNRVAGGWGGTEPKPSTRRKMAAAHRGKPLPESAKQKLSAYWKGRNRNIVSPRKGKTITWAGKISQSKMGHTHSDETRQHQSQARKEYFDRVGRRADGVMAHLREHPEDMALSARKLAAKLGLPNHQPALQAKKDFLNEQEKAKAPNATD